MSDRDAKRAQKAAVPSTAQPKRHIFSHPITRLSRELCFKILHLYRQRPKKDESQNELLGRLRRLETVVSREERGSIAKILRRGVPVRKITRWLIADGVKDDDDTKKKKDEDSVEVREEIGKRKKREVAIKKEKGREVLMNCQVCMEDLAKAKFPEHKIMPGCAHTVAICLGCLRRSIDLQIQQDTAFDQIDCPAQGCAQRLDGRAVKIYASAKAWERYDLHHSLVGCC